MTPVQITRNATRIFGRKDVSKPSADLRRMVQLKIGTRMMAEAKQTPPSAEAIG